MMKKSNDSGVTDHKWWTDVSANAVGGTIAGLVLLVLAFVVKPLNRWLSGQVQLPGWLLVLGVVTALFLGLFLARRNNRKPIAQVVAPAAPNPMAMFSPRFEPSDLEIEILRVLRFADGQWVDSPKVVELTCASSRQDVEQALGRMVTAGWAADSLGNPMRYKLAGRGIDYARSHGFATLTEVRKREKGESPS